MLFIKLMFVLVCAFLHTLQFLEASINHSFVALPPNRHQMAPFKHALNEVSFSGLVERNKGEHLNLKRLMKLESHISAVKLLFLTFTGACQRTHTPARPRVCVCTSKIILAFYQWHILVMCIRQRVVIRQDLKASPGPSRNCCPHSCCF